MGRFSGHLRGGFHGRRHPTRLPPLTVSDECCPSRDASATCAGRRCCAGGIDGVAARQLCRRRSVTVGPARRITPVWDAAEAEPTVFGHLLVAAMRRLTEMTVGLQVNDSHVMRWTSLACRGIICARLGGLSEERGNACSWQRDQQPATGDREGARGIAGGESGS